MFLQQALATARRRPEAADLPQFTASRDTMLAAITMGCDIEMTAPCMRGAHKVSAYLADCTGEARNMLFAACHEALKPGSDPANVQRLLAAFAAQAAADYASDRAALLDLDD